MQNLAIMIAKTCKIAIKLSIGSLEEAISLHSTDYEPIISNV